MAIYKGVAHPVGSRVSGSGFEYYCYAPGCGFLAKWEQGKYTVVNPGVQQAHRQKNKEETGNMPAGPKRKK